MKYDQNHETRTLQRSINEGVRQNRGDKERTVRGGERTEPNPANESYEKSQPTKPAVDAPSPSTTTAQDEIIRGQILKAIAQLPEYALADLVLAVNGGVVFIDGFVRTLDEKLVIGRLIDQAPGVRAVRSNLSITPTHQRSDEAIAGAVRTSLDAEYGLDARRIQVDVRRGILTLAGRVSDENARTGAKTLAASILGVLRIRDRMQLADD
jgi:osmotically-inducible protein OsmY